MRVPFNFPASVPSPAHQAGGACRHHGRARGARRRRRTAPGRGRPVPYRRAPAEASPPRPSHRCFSRSASRSTMPRTIAARSSGLILLRRRNILGARAGRGRPSPSTRASACRDHGAPGRIRAARRAASSRQIAQRLRALPVLMRGHAEEEARLGVLCVVGQGARSNAALASSRHDAVRRQPSMLSPRSASRSASRAIDPQRIAPRLHGVIEAAEPHDRPARSTSQPRPSSGFFSRCASTCATSVSSERPATARAARLAIGWPAASGEPSAR